MIIILISGIPTTPQLAEKYYIDDFEPDKEDDAEETLKPLQSINGDDTNQDMEMFLGCLQSALYGSDQGISIYVHWQSFFFFFEERRKFLLVTCWNIELNRILHNPTLLHYLQIYIEPAL